MPFHVSPSPGTYISVLSVNAPWIEKNCAAPASSPEVAGLTRVSALRWCASARLAGPGSPYGTQPTALRFLELAAMAARTAGIAIAPTTRMNSMTPGSDRPEDAGPLELHA